MKLATFLFCLGLIILTILAFTFLPFAIIWAIVIIYLDRLGAKPKGA